MPNFESVTKALYESASKAKFMLKIHWCDVQTSVVSFGAHEEISSPYLIDLYIASNKEKLPFEKALGKDALLTIITGDEPRYFHGIIAKFRRAGKQGDFYLYQAQMVPYLSLLDLSTDCRIFQNKTVVDIVKDIFKKHGISSDRYKFLSLENEHLQRTYCVQYRETDLNFISRILSEEGIFYYFEHTSEKHVMVFGDNPMNYQEISGETTVTFNAGSSMNPGAENISDFSVSHTLSPNKVAHKDFNYEKTPLKLKGKADGESDLNFEVFDYPGSFQSPEKGDQLANIHLEALTTFNDKGEGESICPRLASGSIFSMDKGKPIKYLAVSVAHGGYQPQVLGEQAGQSAGPPYTNEFLVIPATVTYRPRVHPKPVVTGLQSATVVGPKGEEIHTDEYGRVTVQFHWDRLGKKDDKSSCSLRVAQAWGGSGWGSQFIPRIGDEVLVDFLEGDPDRPIVTGCVYNSDNLPINKSKTQSGFRTKTHKGDGFNELRFDDANGAQEVFLQAEKDFNVLVKNNRTETVYINKAESIGVAKELTIGAGYAVTVGGAMNTGVGLGQFEEVGLSKKIAVGKSFDITVVDSFSITCGKSKLTMDKTGSVTINGAKFDFEASGPVQITGDTVDIN